MKRCLLTIWLPLLSVLCLYAADDKFKELEYHLERRDYYLQQKEERIDSLKRRVYPSMNRDTLFMLYNAIYEAYYTHRFDSAMYYVDRETEVAKELSNPEYLNRSMIHRSLLLTTGGYFSESVHNLQQIDSRTLTADLLTEYYTACQWAYNMWEEYSADRVYAPRYRKMRLQYQDSLLATLPAGSRLHHYWTGESRKEHARYAEAEAAYLKALEGTPVNIRLYAQITYGLALVYKSMNRPDLYEEYLVKAAISDQVCPLKENLALQELAFLLVSRSEAEAERANRYLGYALEDALFYNNRLRMLEIVRKFPSVVQTHQVQSQAKNRRLQVSLLCISLLMAGLAGSVFYILRQMRRLHRNREALAGMNEELKRLNGELQGLNSRLAETNHAREEYVSLFMDLCAAYIEKLERYHELVKRKVKAKQADDLLKSLYGTRLSDADAKEFFYNFDTAFLNLYPDFIRAFNDLLREGEEIVPRRGEILNTDLRIFALMRLGVKDNSKIATLLFYSLQTIYNRRSTVRGKAKDKEQFEKQVEQLCRLVAADRLRPKQNERELGI